MSKKVIIITATAGLVSFAGAFAFTRLTRPAPAVQSSEAAQPVTATDTQSGPKAQIEPPETEPVTAGAVKTDISGLKKSMTEKQLKSLVYDVREKIREYDDKQQELQVREQRLQMAQETLKKDIEELNNLRVELASMVVSLKQQRDELLRSRVDVAEAEKANLMAIAGTYDKMDATSASKIIANMCNGQVQNGGYRNNGEQDAVKILHYMTDRTKAKLLAELVTAEPQLAAALCHRLKQITEN